jgi:hypothetical protein
MGKDLKLQDISRGTYPYLMPRPTITPNAKYIDGEPLKTNMYKYVQGQRARDLVAEKKLQLLLPQPFHSTDSRFFFTCRKGVNKVSSQ